MVWSAISDRVSATVVIMSFLTIGCFLEVSSQTVITYTTKDAESLPCAITGQTLVVIWTEITVGNLNRVLLGNPPDIVISTEEKYRNFNYALTPTSLNLIIENVEDGDGGVYNCDVVGAPPVEFDVTVEVLVEPTVQYESQDVDELNVIVGTSYDLTCSATGARSVSDLSLMWDPSLVEKSPLTISTNGEYKDYSITSTYTAVRGDSSITCQLTGYVMQDEINDQRMENISHTVNLNVQYCNNTGLIAACIEAIIIVVLILLIIYLVARDRLGHGKKREPRSTNQIEEIKGAGNRADMDLQELEVNKNTKNKNLEVPEKNVKLISLLPGIGMIRYHKALVMGAAGNIEAVVRTLSGDSTLRMIELQSSEVQHILKLPGDNSIMKLLGWCDTVPNYLIREYLSGGSLSDHLTEEFSPQKVHQYNNTKQKRFQVAEKGNTDLLPKYALQVARGLQFLTTHGFISPGLRSKKVLLTASGKCKLYDFVSVDNAKEWTELTWNEDVPFQWMPPEFLLLETISAAGDVWSFGVLLWEIFSYGSEPYQRQTRADVEQSLRAKQQLHLPDNCPGAIWQVMITCWETAVEKRPKIDDVTFKLAAMCNEDKKYQEIG